MVWQQATHRAILLLGFASISQTVRRKAKQSEGRGKSESAWQEAAWNRLGLALLSHGIKGGLHWGFREEQSWSVTVLQPRGIS